jgi:fructokinase
MQREAAISNGPLGVVSVGEVLVDFIAHDVSELSEAERFVRAAGGAPANVAVAAARLGTPSGFIGAVGQDAFGDYVRSVLAENGVETSALVQIEPARGRTTLAFVARNTGGIPDFAFYRSADRLLSAGDIPAALIERARFVHVSSMALLDEPAASATRRAVQMARARGALVSFDPNLRPTSWPSLDEAREVIVELATQSDVVKVNDEEARLITGTNDLSDALVRLAAGRRDRLCVITRGDHGCVWRLGDTSGSASTPRVEVADTTGAGDAFVGAMLSELYARRPDPGSLDTLTEADVHHTLTFACAAAAASCMQPGAMGSLPRRDEVEVLLRGLGAA